MWESTEKVLKNSKKGNMITNHTNRYKTASRVGCRILGIINSEWKTLPKPHLVHESFDGHRHAQGREPGWAWWGGEGTIHCDHLRLHKIQMIGKYLTQKRASLLLVCCCGLPKAWSKNLVWIKCKTGLHFESKNTL